MQYFIILSKTTGETLGAVFARARGDAKREFCRQSGLSAYWVRSVHACPA